MRQPGAAAPLRRIAVVGTTGSGKTTMAKSLAERLALPHVELDALHWLPNWTEEPLERFRERTAQALTGDGWVTDGNYSAVRDLVWSRAGAIVWLDYPLPLILWRVIRRTLRRILLREELWNHNREGWGALVGRDSLVAWVLHTYGRRRKEYPVLLSSPEYAHLTVVHLRSPRQARMWLDSLPTQSAGANASGTGA